MMLLVTAAGTSAAPSVPVGPATQPAGQRLRPILTPEARNQAAVALVDRFIAHLADRDAFPAEAREQVSQAWKQARADHEPEAFLRAALAMLSADFKNAMNALDGEDYAKADTLLGRLTDHPDPYLALHAQALRGRSLVEQDKLAEAQAVLEPLADREQELIDKTFLETEVDFLLGYCQLGTLDYDAALATLQAFEREHPQAPDIFRLPARQMRQELEARQAGGLGEVSDLMVYVRRRLGLGRVGDEVQQRQQRVIELLDKLIEQAEQQEQQQSGQGGGGGAGGGSPSGATPSGGTPGAPAQDSVLPGGPGSKGPTHGRPLARPGEAWGKLPPSERDRILQSLRETFPSRYRSLVEQYYRQLAKEP